MITYVSHLPCAGETIKGSHFQTGFGGKGANQAVQIGRLANVDNFVRFIGKVGQDLIGMETRQNFVKNFVDVNCLLVADDPEVPSGVASISVDAQGENCIVIVGGANDMLTANEANASMASHVHCNSLYLLVQLESPLEATLAAMRVAKAQGTKVSMTLMAYSVLLCYPIVAMFGEC